MCVCVCVWQVVSKLSNNPFHVVQKFLILGDLDGLVGVMHEWLQEQVSLYQLRFMVSPSSPLHTHNHTHTDTHFQAHLVLFAQGLSQASAEVGVVSVEVGCGHNVITF